MALKQVKGKIRSVGKTHKVTKAMEAVSAVKMRKSQAVAILGRPYARAALRVLMSAVGSAKTLQHPLTKTREVKKALYLVVTSDKGLAGSLNTAVLKETAKAIGEEKLSKENVSLITLGRKATEYFSKRGYRILLSQENIDDAVATDDVRVVTDTATKAFLSGECDSLTAVYTNFLSTLTQVPIVRKLLPLSTPELTALVEGITPERGKFTEKKGDLRKQVPSYTIEPSEHEVLSVVLPLLLNVAIYHALLESKASEHSARMVAMKNASDKAKEMSRELTLVFNRGRGICTIISFPFSIDTLCKQKKRSPTVFFVKLFSCSVAKST